MAGELGYEPQVRFEHPVQIVAKAVYDHKNHVLAIPALYLFDRLAIQPGHLYSQRPGDRGRDIHLANVLHQDSPGKIEAQNLIRPIIRHNRFSR